MKGRNCYARFFDDPGFEKLLTIIDVKRSFLKLVTLSSAQREPFIRIAVAGIPHLLQVKKFSYQPATVRFYALHFLQGGGSAGMDQLHALTPKARRFKEIP